MLDHFSAVDQSLHALQYKETDSRKVKVAAHVDMTPSSMKKDFSSLKRRIPGSRKI